MAIESPLFQSAMELFGHSISHYNKLEELDRKLVILHLANAIELILKDLVLNQGESIYKENNPKATITIHECIKVLKEKSISIPYLNKIELLIDERNALQHRFGSPNELTTRFYMDIAINFFKEILYTQYDETYEEIIEQFTDKKELIAFQMHEPRDEKELESLQYLAKLHPLGALLSAMTYLDKIIVQFTEKIGLEQKFHGRPFWHMASHRLLERYGIDIPEDLSRKLEEARRLKNLVVSGRKDPTKHDVENVIKAIEKFEKFLSDIDLDEAKRNLKIALQEREEKLNGGGLLKKIVAEAKKADNTNVDS